MDYPTIPLEERALEKLRIVTITDKYFRDLAILFLEHDVTEGSRETVDPRYLGELFAKDRGFYYTATTNLKKLKAYLVNIPELTEENRGDITQKVDRLLDLLEKEPKSFGWKIRAKIGTKKPWYNEAEEVQR